MTLLASEADVYDDVYWTGLYRTRRRAAPLWGSYDKVARYPYWDAEEDFQHAGAVPARLRGVARVSQLPARAERHQRGGSPRKLPRAAWSSDWAAQASTVRRSFRAACSQRPSCSQVTFTKILRFSPPGSPSAVSSRG